VNLDLMMTTTTEKIVDDADHVGAIGLSIWVISLCAFVFVNNFIGPWPQSIYDTVPERIWFLGHVIGGMLFGGGVIVTTCVEWLVVRSKNLEVMTFWFQNVPLLDTSIVLPGLTFSILSGTGLMTIRYGGLKLRAAAHYLRLLDVVSICSVVGIHRSYNARWSNRGCYNHFK
jgi:hypothetical protein